MGLITDVGAVTTIAPGKTQSWVYEFDGGEDVGVATAAPRIWDSPSGNVLLAINQGVLLADFPSGQKTQYLVNITNTGKSNTAYRINVGYFE